MPGKGKYTKYNAPNSPKKAFLDSLFTGGKYSGLDEAKMKEEVVKAGNEILRAPFVSGDTQMFPQGVDMTYGGSNLTYGPPVGDFSPAKNGDPMNAFIPDVSSPGPGVSGASATELGELRTDGVHKSKERNPSLKPEEYKDGYTPSIATKQPAGSTVYQKNVLGEENKFDTIKSSQYEEVSI
jgi:hypothetical protein